VAFLFGDGNLVEFREEERSGTKAGPSVHNDLAQRAFEATRMNQLWFGDIIECLALGNLYLCSLEGT
jgi:hypothetical protein